MKFFEGLKKFSFSPVGIGTTKKKFETETIDFEVRYLHQNILYPILNKIPFSYSLQLTINRDFSAYENKLRNFHKSTDDIDIFHTADTYYPFSSQCVKTGKPTIITQWENIPFCRNTSPYRENAVTTRREADHFIAITERAKCALEIEGVPGDKISVIPPGIDIEHFKQYSKAQIISTKDMLNIPKNVFVVLFIGRIVWEKGISFLLFSFKKLVEKVGKNAQLIIIGNGPYEDQMNFLINELSLKNHIQHIRKIPYDHIEKYYNIANVFCLPSIVKENWQEQLGFVFLEAMACGKPIIATKSGSIQEVVSDNKNGLLVQNGDILELYDALLKVYNDKEDIIDNIQKNNIITVREKFNKATNIKKIVKIYNRVK